MNKLQFTQLRDNMIGVSLGNVSTLYCLDQDGGWRVFGNKSLCRSVSDPRLLLQLDLINQASNNETHHETG